MNSTTESLNTQIDDPAGLQGRSLHRAVLFLALAALLFFGGRIRLAAESPIPEEVSLIYTAADQLTSLIFGSVSYFDTASLEEYRNYYYGFYRNTPFKVCFYFYEDPVTRQQFFRTTTLQRDGSDLENLNPFPIIQINRRSYRCDSSTVDANGASLKTIYNVLEDFKYTVRNHITAESGMLLHRGPFPVRSVFNVAPMLKNCDQYESSIPVTDYVDLIIPRNNYVSGVTGRLMNRQYRWGPDLRLGFQ